MTLWTVLEMLFMYLCPHWDGRCWNHCERHTRFSLCSKQNPFIPSHSFIHSFTQRHRICRIHIWIDFCGLIFTDTSHMAIWFKCNYLLLINSSKLWQIPWHSVLNYKFCFYNWIPRFRPRFLHRGNHRAVRVKNRVDRVLCTTGTWKNLVRWRFHFFSTDLVPKYRAFFTGPKFVMLFFVSVCCNS